MRRDPVVAGRFYEGQKDRLLEQIRNCFHHKLGVEGKSPESKGRLKALISPHAGYMFSGPPASFGFARLKVEKPLPRRVVLMGPKHTHYGAQFSVSAAQEWLTPLGAVKVDHDFCRKICAEISDFELEDGAHQFEHSLEVQLPFLQYVYGESQFEIVPIALGYSSFNELSRIIAELKSFLDKNSGEETIFLISSDFSHDTPREIAYKLDAQVIEQITGLSAAGFYDLVVGEDRSVCGLMPITALLLILESENVSGRLLTYSTSMDVMKHERGVGYASIVFEERS